MSAGGRLAWTAVFGLAFGLVEAAIVVYLRRIYYPAGFGFPLQVPAAPILGTELVREAATLIMLLAVAVLAGRRFWDRFAFFAFAFGVWDLAYYAGLRLVLGWPASLVDWDILFLLPVPWIGPVYAPAAIAVLLVVAGAGAVHLEARGYRSRVDRWSLLLGTAGVAVLLYSFMRDTEAGAGRALPQEYPAWLFLVGYAALMACCLRYFARTIRGGRVHRPWVNP